MGRREKPIDSMAGPVQRFALELRKLRKKAGSPTYREMAKGAGYSNAALARAASGGTLPSLSLTLAYVKACGANLAEWEQRWNAARGKEAVQRQQAMDEESTEPPYRGLARFEPGDHARFFGRTRLTDALMALTATRRCVLVLGPSGSGKSSLLRAGLVPRLQHTKDPDLRPAAIRIPTPGPRPVHDHQERFAPAEGEGDTWLVVDQFEEVFTLCQDAVERREFIDLLLSARSPGSRLRVAVGVRADFYARCLEHGGLATLLGEASLPIGPMTPDELREVIVKPAAAEGLIVGRALTARLIEETGQEPGVLPLISHTLLETWRRRRGRTLTLEGYEGTGGIHGAIAQTAETLYSQLAPRHAEAARRILLRLITPGEGTTPDTRRPVDRAELTAADTETDTDSDTDTDTAADTGIRTARVPDTVLQRLADARLVTLDDDSVDLAHEALITAWPRLLGWIEDNRERLRRHRRLTDAARNWHDRVHDTGALLRGMELTEAQEAFQTPDQQGELTELERNFLHESTRSEQRRSRRNREFMAAQSVLLVMALAAAAIAVQNSTAADTQRRLAVSRELASRADKMSELRPEAATVLALRGYRQAPTTEARSSLLNAYSRVYANQLTGHTDTVESVAFASNGRTLATAGFDHSVKLWDARSHRHLATLTGHTDVVNTVKFSPDGRTPSGWHCRRRRRGTRRSRGRPIVGTACSNRKIGALLRPAPARAAVPPAATSSDSPSDLRSTTEAAPAKAFATRLSSPGATRSDPAQSGRA
ncbi:nSTAND1 domain-containing NTPase [Streptomyces sp. CB02923]|uniref:nSTAND1 domain-containing NTPase n=1 Tax=Streptomyces sp. CB02923 TaxID=1718985 RepID=UPI0018FF80C8|nr:XRE family transcriptional regulator [Streptomyces sp. CB02923]